MDSLSFSGSTVKLHGVIESFAAPRMLTGWVVSSEGSTDGQDITVSVYMNDRLIATGHPTLFRRDIANVPGRLTGFGLSCTEDISDEMIVFDLLRIEARDDKGRTGRVAFLESNPGIEKTT